MTAEKVKSEPVVIDAADQILGRLAVRIANVLRGKDKPTFDPHLVSGEKVLVVNAEKIRVTGRKPVEKIYYRHTQWPRGLRSKPLKERITNEPEKAIADAVRGMLPKNRLRDLWMKRLSVIRGDMSGKVTATGSSMLDTGRPGSSNQQQVSEK